MQPPADRVSTSLGLLRYHTMEAFVESRNFRPSFRFHLKFVIGLPILLSQADSELPIIGQMKG